MVRMNDEEMAWFRFQQAGAQCEWCGSPLDWDKRERQYAVKKVVGNCMITLIAVA